MDEGEVLSPRCWHTGDLANEACCSLQLREASNAPRQKKTKWWNQNCVIRFHLWLERRAGNQRLQSHPSSNESDRNCLSVNKQIFVRVFAIFRLQFGTRYINERDHQIRFLRIRSGTLCSHTLGSYLICGSAATLRSELRVFFNVSLLCTYHLFVVSGLESLLQLHWAFCNKYFTY